MCVDLKNLYRDLKWIWVHARLTIDGDERSFVAEILTVMIDFWLK